MKVKSLRLFSLAALVLVLATVFLPTALIENSAATSCRLCGGDPVPGGHPTSYHPSNVVDSGYTLCGGDPVPGGHPYDNGTQG
jgi:hypothetical protein